MQYIKIHALDNVAVALADLAEGTEVSVDNQTVTLANYVFRTCAYADNFLVYRFDSDHFAGRFASTANVHNHSVGCTLETPAVCASQSREPGARN